MKIVFVFLCMCMASVAIGADSSIYHEDWNDLNKNGTKDLYEDPAQSVEIRINDLLNRMTLDEKIGQLVQEHRLPDTVTNSAERLRTGKISSFLDGSELIEDPRPRNEVQRVAVEQSRLGIPLIFGHDSIHGFRTIFPIPLAQACAWDPDLFEKTQTISARETAAVGINWTFAPMVDLARDPRWGRIAEGFGEDPWLGSLYAAACVRGFQGTNIADTEHVIACMKHYVGYGATEGGRDYNTTEISEYTLRNFYLPPFKAGLDAGAQTVMSAFNLLSGMPASANRHTLTEILRNEWMFTGYVVSDWTAIEELMAHGIAADGAEAARRALAAGVDMEMVSTNYESTLKQQVDQGKVNVTDIDEAVRRVLRVKFRKGLFEKPYVDENLSKTAFLRPDALQLARQAAAESCVLLKNQAHALPLSWQIKRVALIGPFAEEKGSLLGCWAARGRASDVVTLADGLRARLPGAGLAMAQGAELFTTGNPNWNEQRELKKAVDAAARADVVILALGESANWSGESESRMELGLPGQQTGLFDAIIATGKPVIVVLFNGRPLAIPHVVERAAAVLEAWHPGVQGGNAVCDVLFGDVDPQGRLTATFPYSVGQVPIYYNHYNTGRPGVGAFKGNYVDGPITPLFPFGYGLTYTSFEYGGVELNSEKLAPGGALTARVKVKNTGLRSGTEVVQLYIRDIAASAGPRPVRELKGFQKVQLTPGESRDVTFKISMRDLIYSDARGRSLAEPGKFQIWLSKDSATGEPAEFIFSQK